jgi:hypothetical protein
LDTPPNSKTKNQKPSSIIMATKLSTAAAATNDKRCSSAAKGDTLSSSTTATRNKEKYIVRTRKVREEGLYFVGRDI